MNGRPSTTRLPGSVPGSSSRQASSRTHSHSLSVGSINPAYRVDRRRKSTSSNNAAAAAAVLNLVAEQLKDGPGPPTKPTKRGAGRAISSAYATSLPIDNGFGPNLFEAKSTSAITDGPALAALPETTQLKQRARRASDGSGLIKGEGKRQINSELRCEHCGKGYKHSSCLYKHLWEHTPEWTITSKLLISKHQQVQLLEAASVLVQMNQNSNESDTSSADASSSELTSDGASSKAESPPPYDHAADANVTDSKRFSSNSSTYSQSYQSSLFSDRLQHSLHSRHMSNENRPLTSGTSVTSTTDDDREDMSAAFNLLSCSLGATPRSGAIHVASGIPPVPPVPAKYIGQSKDQLSGSTITNVPTGDTGPARPNAFNDVDMLDDEEHGDDLHSSDNLQSDDEEGMFGQMDE